MEDNMNEEMTGMAAPVGDEMMAEPTDPMANDMPAEETPMFDMETLMGNFMDLTEERRRMATKLLASPAVEIVDSILGEPVMSRLFAQLNEGIEGPREEGLDTGMMAPAAEDMPESPMGAPAMEEEATPPV